MLSQQEECAETEFDMKSAGSPYMPEPTPENIRDWSLWAYLCLLVRALSSRLSNLCT